MIEHLAEDNAWARLAEVAWAESLNSGDVGRLLDTIVDHPKIRPYLEQVQADPFQAGDNEDVPIPEDQGEAAKLIGRIRRITEDLDIDHLHQLELLALSSDALRLAEIARARNVRDRDISLQRDLVEEWETRHAEATAGVALTVDSLATLRAQIDQGGMDRERVDAILDLAERLLSVDTRYRETHEQLNRASSEEDFVSVSSLAGTLQSLRIELNNVRTTIDSALAKPQADDLAPDESSKEYRAEPSDSETAVCEVHSEESHRLDGAPLPSAVASEDEISEPATGESTTLSDDAEDDASMAETAADTPRPDDDEGTSVQQVEDDIATAISRDRLGLAYHLARTVPDALPSANTVKLVACNYVTDERAPIDSELPGIAATLQDEAKSADEGGTDQPRWHDQALLIACAALSPALKAPSVPVAQLLSLLEPRLGDTPTLRAMVRTAADVSETGVHLPMKLLRGDDPLDKWRGSETTLRNETTTWLENERKNTIKYAAATYVWRRMLDDWEHNGRSSIGHVFGLLDNPAENIAVELVSRISEYWRANREKEIDRIDRDIRGREARSKKIAGDARTTLGSKVEQALTFFDRWLSLIRKRPSEKSPLHHTEQAERLRATVSDNIEQALVEVETVATPMARSAGTLLRHYAALFKETLDGTGSKLVSLTELLNGDLLADPRIPIDETGQPSESPLDIDALGKLVRQDKPDFGHAAVERARRGDFLNAEAALDFAERVGRIDDESAEHSRKLIEEHRGHKTEELSNRIRGTTDRLDAAYAEGTLTPETYEQQNALLPNADSSEPMFYERYFLTLDKIDEEIDSAKASRRDAICRRLGTLNNLSPEERTRIEISRHFRPFSNRGGFYRTRRARWRVAGDRDGE